MIGRLPIAAVFCAAMSVEGSGLTAGQKRGREIYRRGALAGSEAGSEKWTAAIGPEGVPLPSTAFPCANCHGIWGQGGRESGLEPPPLEWRRLASASVSAVSGRRRDPYTIETLERAITQGLDPSGTPLHAAMPRFQMPAARLADLIAYLRCIGEEEEIAPGVSATRIRVGAALPLSGPLGPTGKSIRATLESEFADVSRQGGIYGRNIELLVEDSGSEPGGILQATRKLIAAGVFALVGSFAPPDRENPDREEMTRLLNEQQVPSVGPVDLPLHTGMLPNPYVFYLLPGLYDQVRALVDFVAAREAPARPRLAALHSGSAAELDAVAGLRDQARLHRLDVVGDGPRIDRLMATRPDYLLFVGDGVALAALAKELIVFSSPPALLSCLVTSGSGAESLPPPLAARALFAAPSVLPDSDKARAALKPGSYLAFRTTAYASALVLVQALRLAGNRPSREEFLHALESLKSFQTGVTAPLSFSPNRRAGNSGAMIMSWDPAARTLVPAGGWITPRDIP